MADRALRYWLGRLRAVLLEHPAELAEFLVGGFALGLGVVLTIWGAPLSPPPAAFWGGVALAAFGLPQMLAAVHGGLAARHASNVLGCFAALANLIRTVRAEVPVGIACYTLVFAACLFFWWRTTLDRYTIRQRRGGSGA
ncbi:MAG: hypothetical protein AAFU73_05305 [Planctomycetota bacterium]